MSCPFCTRVRALICEAVHVASHAQVSTVSAVQKTGFYCKLIGNFPVYLLFLLTICSFFNSTCAAHMPHYSPSAWLVIAMVYFIFVVFVDELFREYQKTGKKRP